MPTNPWVSHVRQYVIDHGVSYKEALVAAKDSYVKKAPAARSKSKSAIAQCREEVAALKAALSQYETKPPRMRVMKEEIRPTRPPRMREPKEDYRARQDTYPT